MESKRMAAVLAAMLASLALAACGLVGGPQSGGDQGGSASDTSAVAGERGAPPSVLTNDNWDQVSADPDRYKGTKVDITGEVFNLLEDSDNHHNFQIYTDPNGSKGNTHVAVQNLSRALEVGYLVHVTGTLKGARVTRAVSGRELKLPEVEADGVDVIGPPSVVTPTAIPSPTVEPSPTKAPSPTPTRKPAAATKTPTAAPTAAPTRAATPTRTPTRAAAPTPTRTGAAGGPTPAATTAAATPQVAGGQLPISVAAASAQLSGPMKASSDRGATSGRYISTSATNQQWDGRGKPPATGEAVLQIEVPRDGTYAVWSRMWYVGADGNSYWLVVDDQPGIKVGNDDKGYSQWKWVGWHDGDTSNRVTMKLKAGVHTLHLIGREANARVDSVLVTDDLKYVPK